MREQNLVTEALEAEGQKLLRKSVEDKYKMMKEGVDKQLSQCKDDFKEAMDGRKKQGSKI